MVVVRHEVRQRVPKDAFNYDWK